MKDIPVVTADVSQATLINSSVDMNVNIEAITGIRRRKHNLRLNYGPIDLHLYSASY